jgi:hypothetical protein
MKSYACVEWLMMCIATVTSYKYIKSIFPFQGIIF